MKKTGYEIIGMIKDDKAPNIIKNKYGVIFNKETIANSYDKYIQKDTMNNYLNLMLCLNDEFEIVEEEKVWNPEKGEEYWYIDYDGIIMADYWSKADETKYKIGNCFKTVEEAQKYLKKLKIYMQLKRYAEEHNTEKIDWKNDKHQKFYIYYDFAYNDIMITDTYYSQDIGQIYFTSEDLCKQAIEEIGEDNIKKLFEE